MSPVSSDQVRQALESVHFESSPKNVLALGLVLEPVVKRDQVRLTLEMPSPAHPGADALAAELRRRVGALDGVGSVDVKTAWRVRPGDSTRPAIPGVKTVIAVASGKGGVGKSTVAVNLAVALHQLGAATGLADLDVYGPSVPVALGNDEQPRVKSGDRLVASEAHGLRFLSMGQLARGDSPVIWRGPMLHKMVTQIVQSDWGELDYLVLDLPPGTGDVQLTVTQTLPLSGAVIVTTPQEIALIDARKGLQMFSEVRTPILGIVENMAYYRCRKCDKEHFIFGSDGGAALARQEGIPLLARLPIDPRIAESGSAGRPLVIVDHGDIADAFRELAVQTAAAVARLSLNANPFKVLS